MSGSTPERPKPAGCKRSACGVASSLDLLGDKWTLLVVRDLLMGKRTYSDFQNSPENIPTNILAERLRRLQQAGIIGKVQYQDRPVRYAYTLTDKGRDLGPVLRSMVAWASKYIPGTYTLEEVDAMIEQVGKDA